MSNWVKKIPSDIYEGDTVLVGDKKKVVREITANQICTIACLWFTDGDALDLGVDEKIDVLVESH